MRCRYCGAENPHDELRCGKCQRRLAQPQASPSRDAYPVIETAAAPALDSLRESAPRASAAPAGPQLAAARAGAAARTAPPVQPALFPYREPRKVVGFGEYSAPPAVKKSAETARHAPKHKLVPGQSSFDFTAPAPPSRPLTREIHRRADYAVAPLQLRAMASLFDLGLSVGFLALFLLTVRLCLGFLPLSTPFLFCYAGAALVITGVYKLLWCMFGHVSLGLQGAHLNVVSFDGLRPTCAQRFMRLFAGWLSVASAGMGVLWALSDQEKLTWHDHISQTLLTHQPPDEEDADR
jgi:uncharacterized RDD family membrane protein YckC